MDDMTPTEGAGVVTGGGSAGALALDAPPSTEGYQAGKLEQRGIELIPEFGPEDAPVGSLLAVVGRGLERRVPLLRRPDRHVRALLLAGGAGRS